MGEASGWQRGRFRPAWAEVDIDALAHNVATLAALVAPAQVCAVVKADGYGHGALPAARAALAGGARWLAVALVEEGVALAEAGVLAPTLLLSEPPPGSAEAALAAGLTVTVCTPAGLAEVAAAARTLAGGDGTRPPVAVHVKVDTGMHRVGAAPGQVAALAAAVGAEPGLTLASVWTHLAVADGPGEADHEFTAHQLAAYDEVRAGLADRGIDPGLAHAANSAAAIAWPAARYDLVRCGIACYGELPGPAVAGALAGGGVQCLRPVLSLKAQVSAVRDLPAGARPSYGRHRPLPGPARVATVPLGYADGVPRRLFETGGEVLLGGRRRPLAGMVTMDQVMVDCGDDSGVVPGDEVVLLGRQGDASVTAGEWAQRLGTISYEVLCGIGPRVPRRLVGTAGRPAAEGAVAATAGGAVVSARRAIGFGLVAGAAAGAVGGAGVLAHRRSTAKYQAGVTELERAGLTVPHDLKHHYVDTSDGGRIHAVERGSGPPLVLVHGVTLGVATWVPQLRRLADRHRVIAVSQRGHGQSLPGDDGFTFERMADDLIEVLGQLKVDGAVLVGHSMGGMVSQVAALRAPDDLRRHVAGLVLLATSAGPMVPGPGAAPYALALANGAGRGIRYSTDRGKPMVPSEGVALWATRACFGRHPTPAAIELTRSMITTMDAEAMGSLLVPILTFDIHKEIEAIDLPTRVVVGSRDLLTPPRMARVMARHIPGARLTEFKHCGHMVMLERVDELNELLAQFSGEVRTRS